MLKKILVLAAIFFGLSGFTPSADAAYQAVPGDLLRTSTDSTVVLVMDNYTRVPVSADGFEMRYHNNFSLIKTVTTAERGSYTDAFIINSTISLPSGTAFMYEIDEPGIYVIDNGYKRLFTTWTGFEALGYDLNDVEWVGAYTLYPTGPSIP